MSLTGKVYAITGANSGIGYGLAHHLLSAGATVVMMCRNEEKVKAAQAKLQGEIEMQPDQVGYIHVDLKSRESAKKAALELIEKYPILDGIALNAGIMMVPYEKTVDGFESQFAVNHINQLALLGTLWDHIVAQEHPIRILFLSSNAHKFGTGIVLDDLHFERRSFNTIDAYAQSKLSNLMMCLEFTRHIEGKDHLKHITVVACHPGYTNTQLQANVGAWYYRIPLAVAGVLGVATGFVMTEMAGSLPSLVALTGEDVKSGQYYGPNGIQEIYGKPYLAFIHPRAKEVDVAEELLRVSEEMAQVKFTF